MLPEPDNTYGMNLATATMNDATTAGYVSIIGTHLYGTPNPGTLASYGYTHVTNQEFWETEMSGNTTDMPGALQEAGWIQNSLVGANMNAFHYWWLTDLISNNSFTIKAYVLGNYSKFIRPEYRRVTISGTLPPYVLLTAYKNSADGTVVIVAINSGTAAAAASLFISGGAPCQMTPWVTSSSDDLAAKTALSVTDGRLSVTLGSQTVTTFVGKP